MRTEVSICLLDHCWLHRTCRELTQLCDKPSGIEVAIETFLASTSRGKSTLACHHSLTIFALRGHIKV